MGQIQNAVGSLVGNVAIGAIAKQSINKMKEELGTTKEALGTTEQALKSTQEDAKLANDMILEGKDPNTALSLTDAAQMQKEDLEFYSSLAGIPFDESKATAANEVVGKQSQFKTSQMKAVRNKIKGGKR